MAILKRKKTCLGCGALFSNRPGLFCRMCSKDLENGCNQ